MLRRGRGRVVPLVPSTSAASGGSNDSIDNLFDDGDDVGQEHPSEKDDDILAETIPQDASEVVVKKIKKSKRKRKTTGDASVSTFPPKKLREDYHAVTPNIDEKSLATIQSLVRVGSSVSSEVAESRDDGLTDSVSGLKLRARHPSMRYVVSSDDSHHSSSHSEVNYFARSPVADAPVMTVAVTTTIVADVYVVPVSEDRVKSGNLENFGDSASVGGANANVVGSSKLNKPATSSDSLYASRDLDSETMHRIYVPKWKVTNDSILDDPYVCRDLTDRLAPPALFSQLRAMDYDQLYTEFNKDRLEDKCAEQTVLLLEKDAKIAHLKSLLSLREAKATEAIRGQLSVVEAADAAKRNELRDLKERNFALKGEKEVLSEKVTTLESVTATKETELASLSAQVAKLTFDMSSVQLSRDELSLKVAFLESERDSLADQSLLESSFELFRERIEAMQDEQAKVLGNRVAELDAQLLEMATHPEEEFYPRFLTTISGRRWILTHGLKLVLFKCLHSFEYLHVWVEAIVCEINKGMQDGLKAGVDHGKAGRDLSVVEAYDPSVEAKYVDAVNALRTVDFPFLYVLKSKKDACMADLMDSLRLEGPLAEISGAEEMQPSLEQLMLPIHRVKREIMGKCLSLTDVMIPLVEPLSSKSLIGEASTSIIFATVRPITTLSTTFASSGVVPTLLISEYQVLDMEPHDEDPPAITFEEEELDTTPE
uniref:Transposase (Putative), gypsy type n=1 Tax=Tanacetum cinerariifolium TaxID=118510 RepID=A0A6L2NF16_TANCI|nr:hypothetical protein [Tanacetum cinerariifolium]